MTDESVPISFHWIGFHNWVAFRMSSRYFFRLVLKLSDAILCVLVHLCIRGEKSPNAENSFRQHERIAFPSSPNCDRASVFQARFSSMSVSKSVVSCCCTEFSRHGISVLFGPTPCARSDSCCHCDVCVCLSIRPLDTASPLETFLSFPLFFSIFPTLLKQCCCSRHIRLVHLFLPVGPTPSATKFVS